MRLTIIRDDHGDFEVLDGRITTGTLSFGEMLEQVTKLAHPEIIGPRYVMRTPEEWAVTRQYFTSPKQDSIK